MKAYTLITFFLLLIHSCKKDRAIVNTESGILCTEVPDSLSPYQPGPPTSPFLDATYDFPKNNFRFPCFNPSNSNEFVFVKQIHDSLSIASNATLDELVIYNLSTKSSTCIVSAMEVEMPPIWGADGWIYFTNGLIPKRINSNTLITEQLPLIYGPMATSFDGLHYAINNIVFNQQGQRTDTLPKSFSIQSTWSNDGYIYGSMGNPKAFQKMLADGDSVFRLTIPELETYTHTAPYDGNQFVFMRGHIQIPNTDQFIIPLTRHGNIWIYDESDSTCVVFKQGAYDSFFNGFSVSNNSKKILASFHREVPTDYSRMVFNVYEKIYIMDINGCNMEEVVLE